MMHERRNDDVAVKEKNARGKSRMITERRILENSPESY